MHPCFFDIEDLSAQRQDGLGAGIAALFGAAARRITLDDVYLAFFGVSGAAVAQLARKRRNAIQRALAARQLSCLFGSQTRLAGHDRFIDDHLGDIRMLHQKTLQLFSENVGNDLAHLRIAQLGLRLSFVLRIWMLDGDDGRQSFPHIITR